MDKSGVRWQTPVQLSHSVEVNQLEQMIEIAAVV